MPMMSARARVTDLDGLDAQLGEIMDAIDQNLEETAQFVEREARISAAFRDKTGKLRKAIKLKKSKFEDGGWIVVARAPHAHLVEFGHVKFLWGRPTSERFLLRSSGASQRKAWRWSAPTRRALIRLKANFSFRTELRSRTG